MSSNRGLLNSIQKHLKVIYYFLAFPCGEKSIKYKCLNISISILNFISASGAQIGPIKEEDDEYDIELRKKKESSNDDRENISKQTCEFEKDKNQYS